MANFFGLLSGDMLNFLVAILALAALCSPKPSLSGIFLLVQTLVLAFMFSGTSDDWSLRFILSIFLGLLTLILTVANLYIEKSGTKLQATIPRMNIFLGSSLLLAFYIYKHRIKLPAVLTTQDQPYQLFDDSLSIAVVVFALLSIIFASLLILDLKNHND